MEVGDPKILSGPQEIKMISRFSLIDLGDFHRAQIENWTGRSPVSIERLEQQASLKILSHWIFHSDQNGKPLLLFGNDRPSRISERRPENAGRSKRAPIQMKGSLSQYPLPGMIVCQNQIVSAIPQSQDPTSQQVFITRHKLIGTFTDCFPLHRKINGRNRTN